MWEGIQGEGSVRCSHGDPPNARVPSLWQKISTKTGLTDRTRLLRSYFRSNIGYSLFAIVYTSDSQSLLRGPLVVHDISSSGLQIPIQINILTFAEH
jgi:hypothetical protein